jgi:uncharacterized protein (DUF433 family)
MQRTQHKLSDPFHFPCYSITEAAHYLRIPRTTLREWIGGSHKTRIRPLIMLDTHHRNALSFVNLVEAYVLDALRNTYTVPMGSIRKALRYLQKQIPSAHPLADRDFQTDGLSLFVEHCEELINVSKEGQITMRRVIQDYLQRIVRDTSGIPIKLYPFTRKKALDEPKDIILDPRIAFGRPILEVRGVPTAVLFERFMAGDSLETIAHDYEIPKEKVEEALRCEQNALAA